MFFPTRLNPVKCCSKLNDEMGGLMLAISKVPYTSKSSNMSVSNSWWLRWKTRSRFMHGLRSPITNLWHSRYKKRTKDSRFHWHKRYSYESIIIIIQSFGELVHRPLLVDLTIEDQSRLKVIYGSAEGFHAVDLDSATVYDIYLPKHVSWETSIYALFG